MKACELCKNPARIYCESDQASLCWDCDEKIHCANFLVAKHTRSLLCHVCQSPTPWKASGPKLGHTVSVCESCVSRYNEKDEKRGGDEERNEEDENYIDDVDYGDEEDEDISDDEEEEEEVEDEENQVVPWSSAPPPPAASSSSSEEEERFSGVSTLKRMREYADLDSDDDNIANDDSTSFNSLRPFKERKTSEMIESNRGEADSTSTAIIRSLKRFQENIQGASEDPSMTIVGIRNLSRDPSAVDSHLTNPNP